MRHTHPLGPDAAAGTCVAKNDGTHTTQSTEIDSPASQVMIDASCKT
jgi:hypothetical protein